MKPASILQQLTLFTVGVVIAAMTLSFLVAYWMPPPVAGRMSIDEMVTALRAEPSQVIDLTNQSRPPDGVRSSLIESALATALDKPRQGIRAIWLDMPGGAASRGQAVMLIDQRDVLVEAAPGGFSMRYGEDAVLRTSTLLPLFAAAVKLPDGTWRMGVPQDPRRQAWRQRIALTYAIGILLFAPLAWFVARRLAGPVVRLGEVAGTAEPIAVDPFPVAGPHELRLAAQAMNAMHGRLRDSSAEQMRMFAALAHDLRTPLTALRLRAETLKAPAKQRFISDLDRMKHMASELLDRASLAAFVPRYEMVELSDLVGHWSEDWCVAGDDVTCGTLQTATVETDIVLLRRAFDNLVENALRYAGNATISLVSAQGFATITIDDTGPGISEDRISDVLKPFVRIDVSRREGGREGAGLGLSIASEASHILGGRLRLINTSEGIRAEIVLPIKR